MRFTTNAVLAAMLGSTGVMAPSAAQALQATKPATVPASTLPAGSVAVTATVTSVKGIVQIRAGEGAAWQPANAGMKLDQGAEIRTGLRSAVQFVVGNDETITLDRLGTVTVLQAIQNQGRAKTDLGMKYGRARYDIGETDLQHESTIRSPGSTLALRGTDIVYEDQAPWVPTAISREGPGGVPQLPPAVRRVRRHQARQHRRGQDQRGAAGPDQHQGGSARRVRRADRE